MVVSSTLTIKSYTGDGSTTEFPTVFAFQGTGSTSELIVIERTIATGAEVTKSYTSHYTVTGGNGSTGTVIAGSAPASTVQWHLIRSTTRTQTIDYVTNDPFPADTHELGLDRSMMSNQEIQEELNRSFKVSKTNAITTPEFTDNAATRASKLLGFSGAGNTLEAITGRINTVSVSAVGAGGRPTVSFTQASGALQLGIVTGNTGAQGPTGELSQEAAIALIIALA